MDCRHRPGLGRHRSGAGFRLQRLIATGVRGPPRRGRRAPLRIDRKPRLHRPPARELRLRNRDRGLRCRTLAPCGWASASDLPGRGPGQARASVVRAHRAGPPALGWTAPVHRAPRRRHLVTPTPGLLFLARKSGARTDLAGASDRPRSGVPIPARRTVRGGPPRDSQRWNSLHGRADPRPGLKRCRLARSGSARTRPGAVFAALPGHPRTPPSWADPRRRSADPGGSDLRRGCRSGNTPMGEPAVSQRNPSRDPKGDFPGTSGCGALSARAVPRRAPRGLRERHDRPGDADAQGGRADVSPRLGRRGRVLGDANSIRGCDLAPRDERGHRLE